MGKIADGNILSEVQFKITATSCKHEASIDGRRPNNISIDKTPDMLKNGIPFVAATADGGIWLCAQHERVGAIDPGKA